MEKDKEFVMVSLSPATIKVAHDIIYRFDKGSSAMLGLKDTLEAVAVLRAIKAQTTRE